jgi:hypothetical protein
LTSLTILPKKRNPRPESRSERPPAEPAGDAWASGCH